ncbi:MAG: hypothetical protein ACREM1_06265, partial [Longimicrobiales bacterium]
APRLYLANGVTTIRTAGAQHPYAELNMKHYELLVEAGFTPEQAIRIMTLNGATVLGEDEVQGASRSRSARTSWCCAAIRRDRRPTCATSRSSSRMASATTP